MRRPRRQPRTARHERSRRTAAPAAGEDRYAARRERRAGGGARVATGCALAAFALLLPTAPGALAAPAPAPAAAPAPPAPAPHADTTAHTVTLVTGERVTLREDASVVVRARPGAKASYVTERSDNDVYVIPTTALPYLGTVLDPALFDVSALVRAGLTSTPVRVEATGRRVAAAAPPSGPEFGAALARQVGADTAAGRFGGDALFGGVTSVKPARTLATPAHTTAGPAAAARPAVRAEHTVRVTVLGTDGAPRPGDTPFGLANVDDAGEYADPAVTAVDGKAEVSVPAGHYSALLSAATYDEAGATVGLRLVTAEFTVPDDDTATDVVLDAGEASEQITVATPKPSDESQLIAHYLRRDASGAVAINQGFGVTDGLPVHVQPSKRPVDVGELRFNVYTHRDAPADAAEPYSYDLKLDNPAGAIASDQHYEVDAGQLTTLQARYHSDKPGRAQEVARLMELPYENGSDALSTPFEAPMQRTEYAGGSSDAVWYDWLKAGDLRFVSSAQSPRPGRTQTLEWLRGPLPPGLLEPGQPGQGDGAWYCQACRKGDTLGVSLATVTDAAGHYTLGQPSDVTSSHMVVSSDGTTLYDRDNVIGAVVTVPEEEAGYTVAYDQTRTNPAFHQSLTTHTVWSFTSARPAAGTVPDTWSCVADDGQYGDSADCSALPFLTPRYQLEAAADGTSPVGDDQLAVSFGHAPGTDGAPAVTDATVEVSFDNGTFWTPATTTADGEDTFRASWTNPATAEGSDVALRVTATDADGNRLTQTVQGAFTVAAAE